MARSFMLVEHSLEFASVCLVAALAQWNKLRGCRMHYIADARFVIGIAPVGVGIALELGELHAGRSAGRPWPSVCAVTLLAD
jgi:hypothetical protein